MATADERLPRSRALRDVAKARNGVLDEPAWFTYTTAGDRIVCSDSLAALLGRHPQELGASREVLSRFVHRDDHGKALGAITRTWTAREPVRTTVRLIRADGGWFDVDCHLEPMIGT